MFRYKEFYLKKFESIGDSYQIPAFIRRLDAIDFFSRSPTLVSADLVPACGLLLIRTAPLVSSSREDLVLLGSI